MDGGERGIVLSYLRSDQRGFDGSCSWRIKGGVRREQCSRKKDLCFFQDASRKVFLPFWLDKEKWEGEGGGCHFKVRTLGMNSLVPLTRTRV